MIYAGHSPRCYRVSVSGNPVVVRVTITHGEEEQALIVQAGNSVDVEGVRIVVERIEDRGDAGGMYWLLPDGE